MGKYKILGNLYDRIFRNDLNKNFEDIDMDIKAQKARVDNLITGNPQPEEVMDLRTDTEGVIHGTAWDRFASDESKKSTKFQELDAQLADIAINVKIKGAVGDGVADDTTSIQAAINEVYNLGGGTAYLPNGIYLVTKRIELKSNVTLKGSGKEHSIIRKSASHSNSEIILVRGTESNARIEHLQIDGVKTDGNTVTTKGVSLQGHNVTVENCKIVNIKTYDGIYIGTSSVQTLNSKVFKCEFDNCDRHAITGIFTKGVHIEGNRIANCGLYAIDLEPNDGATQINEDFRIIKNDIDTTAEHGIVATVKARKGRIQGNNLKNIGMEGIIVAYDSTDIKVEDNILDGLGAVGVAVRLGASKVKIQRNTIKNAGSYGIRIGNSSTDGISMVRVAFNEIIDANRNNASYDYIRTEALSTKCLIVGNDCYSESGTTLPVYAVNLLGVKHRVIGNNFDDFTATGAVYLSSNDNFQSGNYEKGIMKKPIYTNQFRMDESGQVSQESWKNASLLNGWVNHGDPNKSASYFKDKNGNVELSGVIKNGTITNGTTLFTLDAGYRPLKDVHFLASANSSGSLYPYKLTVKSTGDVVVSFLQTATEVSISIPPFRAEQ